MKILRKNFSILPRGTSEVIWENLLKKHFHVSFWYLKEFQQDHEGSQGALR